jgi:hypothetical protein
MIMDNENDKLTIKQSGLWKQASKELQEFFKKYMYFYCGHYNSPLWYYDKDCGMPDYNLSSLYITDESFFQMYLNYFMTELTPKNILPVGVCGDYACFYPELNQILGEKTHILHEDMSEPWCVHIEKPYLLSKDIFELLSKYIVAQLNVMSLFEITAEKIEEIPCLVTLAEIKRVCNAEQFFEWIDSLNDFIRDPKERTISVYDNTPGDSIENFDLCAEWKGTDSELKKLPLFVDIYRKEWESEGCLGYKYIGDVKHQMRVSIDEDSIIHISPDKREVCKFYYEKVMSAMREVNISKWIDGVLYRGVWDDFEDEHYVQYLIDNKYEHNNTRFFRILHRYDNEFKRACSTEYNRATWILVGIEEI